MYIYIYIYIYIEREIYTHTYMFVYLYLTLSLSLFLSIDLYQCMCLSILLAFAVIPCDTLSDTTTRPSLILCHAPNSPIKSLDFRGFDSSRLLIIRGEFSCQYDFTGALPESLTQGLSIGKLLIGGPGICPYVHVVVIGGPMTVEGFRLLVLGIWWTLF